MVAERNINGSTRLQTKFNCSDGHPDRAKQLLKYKTFVSRGKGKVIMKYVTCPVCGRRLCKGEAGTAVEIDCPKCGKTMFVRIGKTGTLVSENPITKQTQCTVAV